MAEDKQRRFWYLPFKKLTDKQLLKSPQNIQYMEQREISDSCYLLVLISDAQAAQLADGNKNSVPKPVGVDDKIQQEI